MIKVKYVVYTISLILIVSCNSKVINNSADDSENMVIEPITELVELDKFSTVLYVDFNVTNGDGSKENPYNSISNAVAASNGGTAVLVAAGVDTIETIILKEDIHLFGGFSPDDWSRDIKNYKTILDGFYRNQLIIAADNSTIDGFLLQNGRISGNAQQYYVKEYRLVFQIII